jgi:phosphoribosylformylglycinamidine (FGAM) synthase-like enzyme
VPVVSGNVSLYNETGETAVLPTPTVGAVGVLDDVTRHATMRWEAGQAVLLLGGSAPALGGSEFLAYVHELTAGRPPALDLIAEEWLQGVVRKAISSGLTTCVHDIGLGGIAVALTEMALQSGVGVTVNGSVPGGATGRRDERWFGEVASSVVVACSPDRVEEIEQLASAASVPIIRIGRTGGDLITLADDVSVDLTVLRDVSRQAIVP